MDLTPSPQEPQGAVSAEPAADRREQRRRLHLAMVRFANGERAAFDEVFSTLWPILRAFTGRALKNTADSEDAAQAALLKVFSRIGDFDRTRDAGTWALAIASYEVMTLMKRRTRGRETDAATDEVSSADTGPEDVAMSAELRAALEHALGLLSEDDVAVLHAEGPLGTTATEKAAHRKRRQRALGKLKMVWRRLYGTA